MTKLVFVATLVSSSAFGGTIFDENFESDLSKWTGQNGGPTSGAIVADPLRPGNKVLTFTEIVLGGDMLTAVPFVLIPGQSYSVEFEYLGLAKPGSVAGDFGGFAGITEDLPGKHLWYMGTRTLLGSTPDALIDDGVWRTYRYDFTPPLVPQFFGPGTFVPQHLMFEDTSLSGGVPGDVFIDNVRLFDTPEPSYTWPCLLAATALLWRRRKKASDEQA